MFYRVIVEHLKKFLLYLVSKLLLFQNKSSIGGDVSIEMESLGENLSFYIFFSYKLLEASNVS
jgi:hypothetical protein